MPASPDNYVDGAIAAPVTQVLRKVEIYEADCETLWKSNEELELVDGKVSCDYERTERRTLQLTLGNFDNSLEFRTGGFWYDKVIVPYRGVMAAHPDTPTTFEEFIAPLGYFLIDEHDDTSFPHSISVNCRDFTKKLLNSKFRVTTIFEEGETLEDVVRAIALAGGIPLDRMIIPFPTTVELDQFFLFEAGQTRWEALTEIVTAYGWEVFFNAEGIFVLQEWKDPGTFDNPEAIFTDGFHGDTPVDYLYDRWTNIASYQKKRRDTRIYNVVVVIGENANGVGVFGVAENTNPASPTSISQIGERVYTYKTPNVTTVEQAEALAQRFLKVMALEEFEANIETLVYPWLAESDIVEFRHSRYQTGDPFRFVVMNLDIPLTLGPMNATLRRIHTV